MRHVSLGMNVSLDGYVARTDGSIDWIFGHFDAEFMARNARVLREVDTFLMGRRTYEGMAAHWPNADDDIAGKMNSAEKVVFSATLRDPEWRNTRVATDSPEVEITRLRQQGGGTIAVAGGSEFARSVTALGLVDSFRLIIHPVTLGAGLPLFDRELDLSLVDVERFPSGVVTHTYRPRAA